ncbi:MAG TPA: hypothetical protein PLG20_09235, partial [Candidatus Syntrophosphaera sp.]|nr:hypothetical protein [Candidatus Syntrophosphaera sp.]
TVVSLRVPRVRIPDSPPFMNDALFSQYLVCDARHPLAGGGKLREELLLYKLTPSDCTLLENEFAHLTGKQISPDSETATLSGGQKVLLMCLLALLSPAPKIDFIDLLRSLDANNRNAVQGLIERARSAKEIRLEGSGHAD